MHFQLQAGSATIVTDDENGQQAIQLDGTFKARAEITGNLRLDNDWTIFFAYKYLGRGMIFIIGSEDAGGRALGTYSFDGLDILLYSDQVRLPVFRL